MPLAVPAVVLHRWPVRPSLGVFGRKWTLPIIRDLFLLGEARFSELLGRNPGMSERILSMRLRDLAREDLVARGAATGDPRRATYRLTARGLSAVPILEGFVQFGMTQLARELFGPAGPPGVASERTKRKKRV